MFRYLFRWRSKPPGMKKNEPLLYDELIRRQKSLYAQKKPAQVIELHDKAISGDAESIFKLSVFYFRGKDVPEDCFFSFRLVRYAAEQGFEQAFSILGKYYAFGVGTPRNSAEAVRWFLQAADCPQDEDILAILASCYYSGAGVPQDEEKAMNYWVEAAERGHSDGFRFCQIAADAGYARGQYILGIFYQEGIGGTPADIEQALYWFHKAAKQNYPHAQCRLGILYSDADYGIEKDPETAVKWFQLAAAQNDIAARSRLADCLVNGEGIEKNIDEAVRILRELAQASPEHPEGEAVSQFRLGALLTNKNFAGHNFQEGIKWLRKSAEQDCIMAQSALGLQYYNGLGDIVKQNWEEARQWFRKAADQGDHLAQFHLGEIYFNGSGVQVNHEIAFGWYKQSSDGGYVAAQQKLAHCYLNGIGTPQDDEEGYVILASLALWGDEEAWTLLQSAAALENAAAENAMWLYYREKKEIETAYDWLAKAAEHGNRKALCSMAIRYDNEGDEEQKLRYLRLAAEKGEAEAQTRLGLTLELLDSGIESPTHEEAFRWMKAAAEQEHPSANFLLGNFYREGTGGEPDVQKAFECYSKAAELGNSDGMERLGVFYANGIAVEEDHRTAFRFYQRSANLGNPKGQCQLGLCYLNGTGCRQDTEVGFQWISIAAETGHPMVIDKLRRSGLDVEKLSDGYKQFRQMQSVVTGDRFGDNFEKVFNMSKKIVIPIPPAEESGEGE